MAMLTFITGNENKAREVGQILGGIHLAIAEVDAEEIQSLSLREVVEHKVQLAWNEAGPGPVIVEDVSLEYAAMNAFPGTFVKFWNKTAGNDFGARAALAEGNTAITARCGAAYYDGTALIYVEGVVEGDVVAKRGESGFGFDPYFQPKGETRTFAEMSAEEKNAISHRSLAFRALRAELEKRGLLPAAESAGGAAAK